MAIAASIRVRRLLLLGRCSVDDIKVLKVLKVLNDLKDFKVIRVVENKTGGSSNEPPVLFPKSLPYFLLFLPECAFQCRGEFLRVDIVLYRTVLDYRYAAGFLRYYYYYGIRNFAQTYRRTMTCAV